MRLKLISCDVFMREVCACVAASPHVFDLDFTRKGEHDRPDELRKVLQGRIDAASDGKTPYDAILLGFGLCGNATSGLRAASVPLVMPRAHDCCTIFLGSRGRFREHFGDNPSRPFSSAGYLERGDSWTRDGLSTAVTAGKWDEYVRLYGEENARYILDTLEGAAHGQDRTVVFIDVPETSHLGYAERFREKAREEGKEAVVLRGDLRLLKKLCDGEWDESEFLTVAPGRLVRPVYDWDRVVCAGTPAV
jgi:hypothetical protein